MAKEIFRDGIGPTGTWSALHEEDGVIYNTEEMPGSSIQAILDHVNEREKPKATKLGQKVATVPTTRWYKWRREWMAGPKQWGISWDDYLMKCIQAHPKLMYK